MKRRAFAGLAVFGLVAAAVAPLMPRVVSASSFCTNTASVNSIAVNGAQQQYGSPGATVTVNGSGFTSLTCNALQINLGTASFTVQPQSSTQFTFTVQPGMSGQLSVAAIDGQNPPQATAADNHLIFITTPSGGGLSNSSPTTGQTVQLSGNNFDFHLPAGWEGYGATYRWTAGSSNGSPCPALPSSSPSLADNQHVNVPMPSQYCDGVVTVTLSAPYNTSQTSATSPRMSFSTSGGFDIAPRTTGIGGSSTAGGTATVSGSGFGGSRGGVTVNGTTATVMSWSDTAVGFVVPSSASSGPVQLTRQVDNLSFSPGALTVGATINGAPSPAKAAVGDTVTLNGAGFGQQSQQSAVAVNNTTASITSWSPTQIAFTVPSGATTGPVAVSPNNGNNAPATVNLQVIPKITGITPTHAAPGDVIEVDGTTFGTNQGTASIGGQSTTVQLWGDASVILQVPQGLSPGGSTVSVAPPNNDSATAPFTVDAPPPPSTTGSSSSSSNGGGQAGSHSGGSQSSSGSSASSSSSTTSFIPPNPAGPQIVHGSVPFVHRTPPPGPVSLRLDSAANQADPGATVTFTVTLMAFGKPIVGAPVDLLLVIVPGADATITPAHAVTDANGQVSGTIHLSKTPGDHIVLARSGIYSDEIRVVGRGATEAVATGRAGTASGPDTTPPLLAVRSPVLWALVACLLLFGVGFGLNLVTSPAFAGASRGAGAGADARGFGGSLIGAAATLGEAARFVAGVGAVLVAHTVGTLRGVLERRG